MESVSTEAYEFCPLLPATKVFVSFSPEVARYIARLRSLKDIGDLAISLQPQLQAARTSKVLNFRKF